MDGFLQIEKNEIFVGLEREYRFFQITDAHIGAYFENSSIDDKIECERATARWYEQKKEFANQFGEFCDERYEILPTIILERIMEYADNQGYDSIIWSGDIMDRVTDSNIRYLKELQEKTKTPIVYCPGNHENMDITGKYSDMYSKLTQLIANPGFARFDFKEFKILTFDNATKNITSEQINFLKNELKEDKKILLVVHAPIKMGEFGERACAKYSSYFVMGVEQDSDNVHKFIKALDENKDKLIAILAGHVHSNFEGNIYKNTKQITTSSALIGVGREIILRWEICILYQKLSIQKIVKNL